MTTRLPDWPRLLGVRMAAVYAGVSISGFKAAVGRVWPEPIRVGKRVLWDRRDLDKAIDRLKRGEEPLVDPFMEAIDGVGKGETPKAH